MVRELSFDTSMLTIPLTAGVLALLSPCGFPMLPGYISYYLGSEETKVSIQKAVWGGIACTLGLLTVFSAIGLSVAAVGGLISPIIPFLELATGVFVISMGVSMIFKIKIPTILLNLKAPGQKGLLGIFLYGAVYGLATLACSGPIFFSILFFAFAAEGFLYGLATFMIYAIGMGIPMILTTILVSKAKELMLRRIMKATPTLQKISGIVLIVVGIYLVYFYLAFYAI